ncbi:hypothetical protein Q5752_004674 [Cryptotrichosporon argae]
MSLVPPPVGSVVPSDDWSEDPSFDLSPSDPPLALASPPSSASSRSSRTSLTHQNSPLRQSHTSHKSKPRHIDVDDMDDLDFDLPGELPALRAAPPGAGPTASLSSTATSLRNLSAHVVGAGPAGVGTITRLGSNGRAPLPAGTVRARARAIEQAWEADVDFGSPPPPAGSAPGTGAGAGRRLTLSPSKKTPMPGPDALDALDDLDFDDEQGTLKAGGTIKALLPPRRIMPTAAKPAPTRAPDDDEDDFVLPLNLTNLTLASQAPAASAARRPRDSNVSNISNVSTASNASAAFSWDSSPVSRRAGLSETSGTSVSSGSVVKGGRGAPASREDDDGFDFDFDDGDNDGDGYAGGIEAGLVLPDAHFFAPHRADALNRILDRKRKPQYAPPPPESPPHALAADESFEDGLVLDNPRAELSHHRLRQSRRARTVPVPFALGSERERERRERVRERDGKKTVTGQREKAWNPRDKEREHERDHWAGRQSPFPPRAQPSTLGLAGVRSHSSGAASMLSAHAHEHVVPATRRAETPGLPAPARETRARLLSSPSAAALAAAAAMPPPPLPPLPAPRTPSHETPSRLRHQKSHAALHAQPSLSLARKQSLASLQDALAAGPHAELVPLDVVPPLPTSSSAFALHAHAHAHAHASAHAPGPPPGSTSRSAYSTSRLTQPTSSSRAKMRQPVHAVFTAPATPSPSAGALASSPSAATPHVATPRTPRYAARAVEPPRRAKPWGDGTELEGIEDLRVDDERTPSIGLSRPGRRADKGDIIKAFPKDKDDGKEKRKKSGSAKRRPRKPAMLIKHLGAVDKKKVVGEMTWNPATLRWEGNDAVLRDFDAVASSTRPALIAHYTGSSFSGVTSPSHLTLAGATGAGAGAGSGAGAGAASGFFGSTSNASASLAAAATVRIVGDMRFDPERMCWVSLVGDDADPFEGMADDEDDEAWLGGRGGTITRASGRRLVAVGLGNSTDSCDSYGATTSGASAVSVSAAWSSRLASESGSVATTGSWDDRMRRLDDAGAGDHDLAGSVPAELRQECRDAEERHRRETRGWVLRPAQSQSDVRDRERREEKRLWEVRNLAVRS